MDDILAKAIDNDINVDFENDNDDVSITTDPETMDTLTDIMNELGTTTTTIITTTTAVITAAITTTITAAITTTITTTITITTNDDDNCYSY